MILIGYLFFNCYFKLSSLVKIIGLRKISSSEWALPLSFSWFFYPFGYSSKIKWLSLELSVMNKQVRETTTQLTTLNQRVFCSKVLLLFLPFFVLKLQGLYYLHSKGKMHRDIKVYVICLLNDPLLLLKIFWSNWAKLSQLFYLMNLLS